MSNYFNKINETGIMYYLDNYFGNRVYGIRPELIKDRKVGPVFRSEEQAKEWIKRQTTREDKCL